MMKPNKTKKILNILTVGCIWIYMNACISQIKAQYLVIIAILILIVLEQNVQITDK